MYPDLFRPIWHWLGVNGPDAYTSFELLAVLVSVPLAFFVARRLGLSWPRFGLLCGLTYATALLCSKTLWLLTVTPTGFITDGIAERGVAGFLIKVMLPPWRGGQVFYGSVLGVGLAALLLGPLVYWGTWKTVALRYLDVCGFALLAISAVGRVGCHFAGCCFGAINQTFGISFPPLSEPTRFLVTQGLLASEWMDSPPLFPTQLLEAFTSTAILFWLLVRLRGPRAAPGWYAMAALGLHAVTRFFIEFLRFDPRGSWGPLTTSQWLGLVTVAALLVLRVVFRPPTTQHA